MDKKMILEKVFSRERGVSYFQLWNDTDKEGWLEFLGHELKFNLFIINPPGKKSSVWYDKDEYRKVFRIMQSKALDENHLNSITNQLDKSWIVLKPFIKDQRTAETVEEFEVFYGALTKWWSAMTSVFSTPDSDEVPEASKKMIVSYRKKTELYTEKMAKIMLDFWINNVPAYKEYAYWVTPKEMIYYVRGESKNLISELEQRLDGCVMVNGHIYPINRLDDLLEKHNAKFDTDDLTEVKELKGVSAYLGRVTGKVKKVMSIEDMKNFEKGEILVTEMTSPHYVPAIKSAAAVITEEGGMMCHAAIVARELKKPCIIGTKIATQVLKDGDVVEVDADNGVVKIIK